MPRLGGIYKETRTTAASPIFILDVAVLALKLIAVFHGFQEALTSTPLMLQP